MQAAPQPQDAAQPVAAAAAPIGGMTTIDAGEAPSGLLVEGEEAPKRQSQPRRNGEGRSRRPRKPAAVAEAPVTDAPSADAAPTPTPTES